LFHSPDVSPLEVGVQIEPVVCDFVLHPSLQLSPRHLGAVDGTSGKSGNILESEAHLLT
jgi:hypothetical protein